MNRRNLIFFAAALTVVPQASFATSRRMDGEIVLGTSLPLTGVIASNAREFQEGSRLVFESVNAVGGIHGRKLRQIVLDDKFDKAQVVANAKALLDEGAFCFYGFMGTPGILDLSKKLSEVEVPLIGAVSGSPALKNPLHRYVFVLRASFAREAAHAVEIGITLGVRSWGVVYQDDAQGKAALDGVSISLASRQLKPLLQVPFAPSAAPDFASTLDMIAKDRPSALVFGGSAPALATFVKTAKQRGQVLPPTTILSVVSPETAVSLLGDDALGLRFTQPVPYPFSVRRGSSFEYSELVKRHSKERPSFIGMEGFLTAKLMVKALQMTPSMDRRKLLSALESMKNLALTEDFRVTYGSNDRTGSTYVDTLIVGRQGAILR